MMMSNFQLDLFISFGIAFSCVFILLVFFGKRDKNKSYEKKLAEKLEGLIKQQEVLLESTSERASSFMRENEGWDVSSSANSSGSIIDKIKMIKKKAGIIDMSLNVFIILCSVGGIGLTCVLLYFDFAHPFICVVAGMFVGAYLVYNILAMQASQRKALFLQLFPDAIDMMIRGVKAGLNISRVIKLVSIESSDPIASEYRTISQKFDMGVKPDEALVEAADRVDIEEFRFLVVALVLQMENGGELAEILANLSNLVRKRLEFGMKVKAMSAEAKMSAIVMSALPFGFAGIMMVVNPSHLHVLIEPGTGQTLFKIGVVLFSVGTFIMIKIATVKV